MCVFHVCLCVCKRVGVRNATDHALFTLKSALPSALMVSLLSSGWGCKGHRHATIYIDLRTSSMCEWRVEMMSSEYLFPLYGIVATSFSLGSSSSSSSSCLFKRETFECESEFLSLLLSPFFSFLYSRVSVYIFMHSSLSIADDQFSFLFISELISKGRERNSSRHYSTRYFSFLS